MQSTKWCGTIFQGHVADWNNRNPTKWAPDLDENVDWVFEWPPEVKFVVWQIERSEEGNLHIQAYIQLKQKKTLTALRDLVPGSWQVQSAPKNFDAAEYCRKKDGTFVRGHWEKGQFTEGRGNRTDLDVVKEAVDNGATKWDICCNYPKQYNNYQRWIDDYFEGIRNSEVPLVTEFTGVDGVVANWHKWVMGMVEQEPHCRKLFWFVDRTGGTGKSFLATYLQDSRDAFLCSGGKYSDIVYAYSMDSCKRVVVLDLPRDADSCNVAVLESFKNGRATSTKYKSRTVRFPRPHVLVFANHPPGGGQFSSDRLVVVDIVDGEWSNASAEACLAIHPVEM